MEQLEENEFLIHNGHWLALGISIAIVLGSFVVGTQSKVQKTIKRLDSQNSTLLKRVVAPPPEAPPAQDFLGRLRINWEQTVRLDKGPSPLALYEGPKFQFNRGTAPAKQWINTPRSFRIERDREELRISWSKPSSLRGKKMTTLHGYFLAKQWKDKNTTMTELIDVGSNTDYTDRKLESRLQYKYWVYAYSRNKDAQGGKKIELTEYNLKLSPGNQRQAKMVGDPKKWLNSIVLSAPASPKRGELKPVYRLSLQGIAGDQAIIQLEKFIDGEWRRAICRTRKGENIIFSGRYDGEIVTWDPKWKIFNMNRRATKTETRPKKVVKGVENGQVVYDIVDEEYTIKVPAIGIINQRGKKAIAYRGDIHPKNTD